MNQDHTVEIVTRFQFKELESNFNCTTLIYMEKSHNKMNEPIDYTRQTIFKAVGTMEIRTVTTMCSKGLFQNKYGNCTII